MTCQQPVQIRRIPLGQSGTELLRLTQSLSQHLGSLALEGLLGRFELAAPLDQLGFRLVACLAESLIGLSSSPGTGQPRLGFGNTVECQLQRPDRVRPPQPDVLLEELLDPVERRLRRLVRTGLGGRGLQLLLECLGRRVHSGDLRLPHGRCGEHGVARQTKPARRVGGAVGQELLGQVLAGDEVGDPTVARLVEVLRHLDPTPVVELQLDSNHPALSVPGSVVRPERLLGLLPGTFAAPPAADTGEDRRVPARLAGLVRPADNVHRRTQIERFANERTEGDGLDLEDPQTGTSRSSRPSSARMPVTSTR